ncbi:MAG: GNAT family N-acetyltransferase [Bacteroidota bacterium]
MELEWMIAKWDDLDTALLYKILELRSAVFVVEQTCVYQDIDGKDQESLHVYAMNKTDLVAYARIVPGSETKRTSIGRVLIHMEQRGKKIGDLLMKKCIEAAAFHFPDEKLQMSAQKHLSNYYQKHGFQVEGEPYLEDGIPHVLMKN